MTWFWAGLALAGCQCGAAEPSRPGETPAEPAQPSTPAPSYEVHEWGLVRGTLADTVRLSGPHIAPPAVPVAKPLLYFHREGEGALIVDVEVRLPNGRIVEHWPSSGRADPVEVVTWRGVTVQEGTCRGSRYPSLSEPPCSTVADGCEAAELASVETRDGDCLFHPRPPPPGGPTLAWNHLFYRGEVRGTPALPLRLEPGPDGSLRVTATGSEPIPGRLVRVRRPGGTAPVPDGALAVDPPAPGQTIVVPPAAGALSDGAAALGESLRAAGLTDEEAGAFRRAWDATLFHGAIAAAPIGTTPVAASPVVVRPESSSVLYVLPIGSANALATLRFTPAPRAVRRAIVAWIDEPAL